MDNHLNIIRRDREEMHGLDELEPFIHHGGAVYRDFGTHIPVWMLDRLLRCDCFEFGALSAAERPSGTGEKDLLQFFLLSAH